MLVSYDLLWPCSEGEWRHPGRQRRQGGLISPRTANAPTTRLELIDAVIGSSVATVAFSCGAILAQRLRP